MLLAPAVLLVALLLPFAGPAAAQSVDQALIASGDASARVEATSTRLAAIRSDRERRLAALAIATSAEIRASSALDAAGTSGGTDRLARRARALYMAGGPAADYVAVLASGSVPETLDRVAAVERVLRADQQAARRAFGRVDALRRSAEQARVAASAATAIAGEVAAYDRQMSSLLVEQQALLAVAGVRLRVAVAARERAVAARERARAARAAVAAAARQRAGPAPSAPSADFRSLYVAAARTCPGLSWTVLAAIGQVESAHGENAGTSSAGAQGPMQFLPSTFAAVAVDGDSDGDTDIADPADAVFSAAAYLCGNGAGQTGEALRGALWAYNHATWYVDLVLRLAGNYGSPPG